MHDVRGACLILHWIRIEGKAQALDRQSRDLPVECKKLVNSATHKQQKKLLIEWVQKKVKRGWGGIERPILVGLKF